MSEKERGPIVRLAVKSISGVKLDESVDQNTPLNFNIKVNMEEVERKTDQLSVRFAIRMDTEPPAARFEVEGAAQVIGGLEEIEGLLQTAAGANVPQLFAAIYPQVYAMLFVLAGVLQLPYPSPGLIQTRPKGVTPPEESLR